MSSKIDPALAALALALDRQPDWVAAERIAFLHARPHQILNPVADRLVCEQTWKPSWDRLAAAGLPATGVLLEEWNEFDLVLLLPERQREQTLFDLARGMRLLRPNGKLIVSLPNNWGAVRCEQHLAELAGEIESLSKFHCRAFAASRNDRLDRTRLTEWLDLGRLKPQAGIDGLVSSPGLFSWNEIDRASQLLIENLPETMPGSAADLGCGWGFLSRFLLTERPLIKHLDLYDADARALEAARANLADIRRPPDMPTTATDRPTIDFRWHDVTQGLEGRTYDWIVMNPPFHVGRAADPLLGHRFIVAAGQGLRPGGQLWMVANQNLPYERFLADGLPGARLIIQKSGFKILAGQKSNHRRTRNSA